MPNRPAPGNRAPPRVLHIVESWPPVPSGYATRSHWIVAGQARTGISRPAVIVTARQRLYGQDSADAPDGVPVTTLAPSRTERRLSDPRLGALARPFHVDGVALERAVRREARERGAEILHVHWSSAIGAAAARAARALDLPLVAEVRFDLAGAMNAQTFRGRASWLEGPLRRHFERHLTAADRIVAASEALATLLRRSSPALADRVHVVPNGIDAEFVARSDAARAAVAEAALAASAAASSAGPASAARVTLGTTSKMLRYENLDVLLRLCATRPSLDLVFVGDGPERARLEKLAAPLNAERDGRVRFTGQVAAVEIPARLARLDLFVVPRASLAITRFASPLKVVEAMAAARAVVATAVGDSATLLGGGRGVLVPPGSDEALGGAVDSLVADASRRRALGAAARAHIVDAYDGDRLLARYARVYAGARSRSEASRS